MPNLSYIYNILNADDSIRYIGSTSRPVYTRWLEHQSRCRKGGSGILYDYMIDQGIDNFRIEIIETLEDVTVEELRMREDYHIRNTVCINELRAHVPEEERREYNREYNRMHRERIASWKAERIQCECGIEHSRGHKACHFKSSTHQRFVETQSEASERSLMSDEDH